MTEYLRSDFLSLLGDFILQDSSPLHRAGEPRVEMGNYYLQPDFDKALLLITIMMSEQRLLATYPMSETATRISQSKAVLQALLKANDSSYGAPAADFTEMLALMCHDSYANTRKMAKGYVRELLNKNHVSDI